MRHRSEIESDAAAIADKPVLSEFDLGQLLRLNLEVLLDIREQVEYRLSETPAIGDNLGGYVFPAQIKP